MLNYNDVQYQSCTVVKIDSMTVGPDCVCVCMYECVYECVYECECEECSWLFRGLVMKNWLSVIRILSLIFLKQAQ